MQGEDKFVHPKELLQIVITSWWQLVWHGLKEESMMESMPVRLVGCTTGGLRKDAEALACPKPVGPYWFVKFVAEERWSSLLSRTGCTKL